MRLSRVELRFIHLLLDAAGYAGIADKLGAFLALNERGREQYFTLVVDSEQETPETGALVTQHRERQ